MRRRSRKRSRETNSVECGGSPPLSSRKLAEKRAEAPHSKCLLLLDVDLRDPNVRLGNGHLTASRCADRHRGDLVENLEALADLAEDRVVLRQPQANVVPL